MTAPPWYARRLILEPRLGSPWAEEMVLNPGLIQDPRTGRIHMLFRATGPWFEKRLAGKPPPYPIFLGYAWSDDGGETWRADFSRPALAPRMNYEADALTILNRDGEWVTNHANGCIEDPRLFFLDGHCWMTAACRLMPPGPYWIRDDPLQCAPDWVKSPPASFGKAASENVTVNVLYQVDLACLSRGAYDRAFQYVAPLTDPACGDNRDAMLFPEKLTVNGRPQYVCLHRPVCPAAYPAGQGLPPSIFLCASDAVTTLQTERTTQTVLAAPLFPWEGRRIGASAPPLRVADREWLLCYHGKQDDTVGYTQSFMLLEEQADGLPRIAHRCSERTLFAQEPWEQPHKFKTPCVFVTGMIRVGPALLVGYGAADERVGVARINEQALLRYLRTFDARGGRRHP